MDPENIVILSEEEVQNGRDVQLEKAIEILLNEEQKQRKGYYQLSLERLRIEQVQ